VAERVALFIDYQNMHFTALGEFCPYGTPPEDALVHPLLIAERIVQKRSTKRASALEYVKVYRGRPNPAHHPSMTSANDAQKAAWERDARVTVIRRDLNYRGWPQQPPREKGIDVKLAVDLVQSSMLAEYDVAVVFSGDTDLLPALEMAFHYTAPMTEIACWTGAKPLWFPDQLRVKRYLPYCHFLNAADFQACRDTARYTVAGP
jgi:uncharacterized LabA/DUF88 family protein